jgi:hypothetical protein
VPQAFAAASLADGAVLAAVEAAGDCVAEPELHAPTAIANPDANAMALNNARELAMFLLLYPDGDR